MPRQRVPRPPGVEKMYAGLPDINGLRSRNVRAALAALPTADCVLWAGKLDRKGYGLVSHVGRGDERAHRVVYQHVVGAIPDGHGLDHLCHTLDRTCAGGAACRHRACVNPAHLEPVTVGENVRRGALRRTLCKNGHLKTPDSSYVDPKTGWKSCRTCRADADRRRRPPRSKEKVCV